MDIRKLTEINVLFKPDLILIALYVFACYKTRTGITNWHQNLSFALDVFYSFLSSSIISLSVENRDKTCRLEFSCLYVSANKQIYIQYLSFGPNKHTPVFTVYCIKSTFLYFTFNIFEEKI